MNTIVIFNKSEIGGALKCGLSMLWEMKKLGVKTIVLTPKKGIVYNFCVKNNIKCYVIKYIQIGYSLVVPFYKRIIKIIFYPILFFLMNLKNSILAIKLKKYIDFDEIDMIHTNVGRDNFGVFLSKRYKKKNILHLREFGTKDFNCIYLTNDYFKYINKSYDSFIAVSNSIKEFYIKNGVDEKKINVIYDGIENDKIKFKESVNKDKSSFKITTLSGISHNKGQYQIIEALNLIPKKEKEKVELYLYGGVSNEYKKELLKLIRKFKLDKQIFFMGYCDNIYSSLSSYDLAITPSKSEAFGRVTVECMFAKLPVIVSNTGANVELIDENTGIIYEYENYEDLAKKILFAIENPGHLYDLSKNAYQKAINKFKSDNNAKEIVKLYNKVKGEN